MNKAAASMTISCCVDRAPAAGSDGEKIGPWQSTMSEATNAWLCWSAAELHVTVCCEFQGDLPRETDSIEIYTVDAHYPDSLIRVAVNSAGTLSVMGGGELVVQPKWGYWHHKPLDLGVEAKVVYFADTWKVHVTIPFTALGMSASEGAVLPINLIRCEHRLSFGYPNFGCTMGARRTFWPLAPSFDPHLPVFYPRLKLGLLAVPATASAEASLPGGTTPFAFRGLMLDQSRGALKFSDGYLRKLAARLRDWGFDRFMIYTEGEFAPSAYPAMRLEDSYDAASFRQLGHDLGAMGMEVIPCHAMLGHMDRALGTPELAHLREDGRASQICLSHPESYTFLGSIIDELCAASSGTLFHANVDESLLLGMCPACRDGMHQAGGYGPWLLRHLLWLRERVAAHGRRLLIWADMVLRLPEVLEGLPRDVVLADWEYDDFGTYPALAHIKEKGFDVLACPWLTLANHRTFSQSAHKAGIHGFLQTHWTRGNRSLADAWPAFYHSSVLFGSSAPPEPHALWTSWERLLGASGTEAPLPWAHYAPALVESGENPAVQLAYCTVFLDGWSRFDINGPFADVLYELRRELLLQCWRIAQAGQGGEPPSILEVDSLMDEEKAFRRGAVHVTASTGDPRITALQDLLRSNRKTETAPSTTN